MSVTAQLFLTGLTEPFFPGVLCHMIEPFTHELKTIDAGILRSHE
jgi:hypothetical protein